MITKDNNLKIMEWFFKYPSKSFHIRELARLTKLSSTGVIKIVKRLKSEKLLISKKEKVVEDITPNFDGNFFIQKRLYNIYSLYDSGLVSYLSKFYEMPESIILFGSYSNGTDTERSDIDIGIFSKSSEIPDTTKFEKKFVRKINLHLLDKNKLTEEFKNSLCNGVVLEGVVEIK